MKKKGIGLSAESVMVNVSMCIRFVEINLVLHEWDATARSASGIQNGNASIL